MKFPNFGAIALRIVSLNVLLLVLIYLPVTYLKFQAVRTNLLEKRPLLPAEQLNQHLQNSIRPSSRFLRSPDTDMRRSERPRPIDRKCLRAVMSPVGDASSDGMGHRLAIVIYELNLAHGLDVAYLHRVSPYGSLTKEDPESVQRLFGWNRYKHLRSPFLKKHCVTRRKKIRGCTRTYNDHEYCERLRDDSPLRKLVVLPQSLTDCISQRKPGFKKCVAQLRAFAQLHPGCGTLFQALPSKCSFDYTTGSTEVVSNWLRSRYWGAHTKSTQLVNPRKLQQVGGRKANDRVSRRLPFRERALQIAVHVRRGDVLSFKHRFVLPDATYGAVVAAAAKQAQILARRDIEVDVNVFSEGAPPVGKGILLSIHDIRKMTQTYLTENGTRVRDVEAHWLSVLQQAGLGASRSGTKVRVNAFIATDTISTIHAMLCADVFVGSVSGLSYIVAKKIGRGLMLLPTLVKRSDEPQERTVYFNPRRNERPPGEWMSLEGVRNGLQRVLTRDHRHPEELGMVLM